MVRRQDDDDEDGGDDEEDDDDEPFSALACSQRASFGILHPRAHHTAPPAPRRHAIGEAPGVCRGSSQLAAGASGAWRERCW